MHNNWHKPPFILKEVKIEITHKCPLNCVHCSSEASPDVTRKMPYSKLKKLLKEIIELKICSVDISGGEPLEYEKLDEIVSTLSTNGIQVSIYTSGVDDDFKSKIEKLSKLGLGKIIFSIFGSDAKNHELITRIKGSFSKTLSSIKKSIDLGLNTELHFVPFKANYRDLPNIVDLALEIGIRKISVLRFVPQGRGAYFSDEVLSKQDNIVLKKIIEENKKKVEIRTGSPYNFLLVNDRPKCNAGIDRISIGPEFDIYPCDAFKQIDAVQAVGNNEFSNVSKWSLKECWEKSHYLKEVRDYLTSDFYEDCCECELLSSCLSGCLAQKVIKNNDFRKDKDPMCIKEK